MNDEAKQPEIAGKNSVEVARNTIKQNRKKEFQKKREELIKKLDDAFKIFQGIVGEIQELDEAEGDTISNLDSLSDFLLGKAA